MKRKTILIFLVFVFLLSACGGGGASTPEQPAAPVSGGQSASASAEAATATPALTAEPTPIPAPTLPPLQVSSGRYIYTDANYINDIVQFNNLIFAGGRGGLVSWDIGSGIYRKFTTLDGLRHISIYEVVVCNMPEPRIVIGHDLGVDLFDPAAGEFSPLVVPDAEAGLNTKVSALYCDQPNNRLLIGYEGVGVYDFGANTYTRYTRNNNGLSWNGVSGLAVIGKDIWVLTGYNGANVIKPDGKVVIYDEAGGMPSQRAYSAAQTKDGTIWVGTSKGLLSFKGGKWALIEGLPGEINNLLAAPDGTLWFSTYPIGTGKLCQFDPAAGKCVALYEHPRDGIVNFALIGETGQPPQLIFYGTRQGLRVVKPGSNEPLAWTIADDERLASNFVASMALDSENRLWVGTDSGINVIDPANPATEWTTYRRESDMPNTPGGNWASQLVPAENGAMWAAMTNGQLSYFDGAGRWTVFEDKAFYSVRVIGLDAEGRAWIAKDDQPVRVLKDGQQVAEYTVADGLPEGRITTLFRDGDALWIGGNGLARYQDGKLELVFGKDEMSNVIALARDLDGNLLIARANSLIRLDSNNIPSVVLKGDLDSDILDIYAGITSMALDSNGVIYLGTSQGLLISNDNGASWTRITTQGGITTNYLRVVFVDQYDTLWMGGGDSFAGGGLMRYVP